MEESEETYSFQGYYSQCRWWTQIKETKDEIQYALLFGMGTETFIHIFFYCVEYTVNKWACAYARENHRGTSVSVRLMSSSAGFGLLLHL